jgi:hypothetical protein
MLYTKGGLFHFPLTTGWLQRTAELTTSGLEIAAWISRMAKPNVRWGG